MTNPTGTSFVPTAYGGGPSTSGEPANLGDILERVLDRGVVIAGDIKVNLLDIELLTIKLRLLVVSVETARQMGIDWWAHDPWLSSGQGDLAEENRELRERLRMLEGDGNGERAAIERGEGSTGEGSTKEVARSRSRNE